MSNETFQRTALDGKDREQLQAIASALGLKAISRLKKAELVEAILDATADANGASGNGERATAKPRTIRSTGPAKSDLDALADEEAAIAASAPKTEPEIMPVRRRAATAGETDGNR